MNSPILCFKSPREPVNWSLQPTYKMEGHLYIRQLLPSNFPDNNGYFQDFFNWLIL